MIFEAVAAIEVANQAIRGIKELAGHVTSVGQMGKHLTNLADAHEDIQRQAEAGDANAFFHLEEIKQREYEIKQLFIYAGRAGLWTDYQTFIRNRKEIRRKQREREKAQRLAKRKAIKNGLAYTAVVLAGCLTVAGGIWLLLAIMAVKGR
jgi:hypothetical protein|tara:strand:+ start:186 stop:635 length:450 start_codon:yes stop_codon:yes gene_type:complete